LKHDNLRAARLVPHVIAFVADMPFRVCINEILGPPTWNRVYLV
jgi:hypothetical protein